MPLPTSTYIYSDNVIQYTFTNHCSSASASLGTISFAGSLDGTPVSSYFTKGSASSVQDSCSNTILAPYGTCTVYVSAIPTSTGSTLSVEASLPYTQSSQTKTAIAVSSEQVSAIPNQTTTHTLTFVNQCTQPIWIEFANGNGQPANTGVYSPDPLAGSAPSAYLVAAQAGGAPTVKTISVAEYENGKIYARTGCDPTTMICATASCEIISGTGTCSVGAGAGEPTTAFESYMTGTTGTDGVYDVSLVNGFNIPVEIKGLGPISTGSQASNPNLPYQCTAAGAPIQPATSFPLI